MIPLLSKAIVRRAYRLGGYSAALLTGAQSPAPIQYLFVLAVVKDGETAPCYLVTSEINTLQDELLSVAAQDDPKLRESIANERAGAPVLGTIERDGSHSNLGSSEDWRDLDKFAAKALELASNRTGFHGAPVDTTTSFRATGTQGLNLKQRWALAVTAAVIVLMILYPPVQEHFLAGSAQSVRELTGHAGYRFLFSIGEDNSRIRTESINVLLLLLQCVVVIALGAGIALLFRSRR